MSSSKARASGGYGQVFREHRVTPKKRLGQHFMIDPGLLRAISELIIVDPFSVVLELGAGTGTLTRELCRRAQWVYAVEMDQELKPVSQEITSGLDNLSWRWGDALESDLAGRDLRAQHPGVPLVLCGNLPYYITSDILYRALVPRSAWCRIGFVVQLEVGERICAPCGGKNYGRLSLWCQYRARVSLERKIPRGAFLPRPEVGSCLVILDIKDSFELEENEESFMDVLSKAAFSQRRKTILNGISTLFPNTPRRVLFAAISDAGLNPEYRPESLGLEGFVTLTRALLPLTGVKPR